MVLATLYKDIYNVSFHFLFTRVDFHYSIAQRTITTNVYRVRSVLSDWAEEKIILGDADDWRRAAHNLKFPKPLSDTNLWIDSVDVLIEASVGRGSDSDYWSGKEKHAAWRFMVVSDAKGGVRKLLGGYFPSTHDNSFLQSHKEEFERSFEDAVMVGDQHFAPSVKTLRSLKMYAPVLITKPKTRKRKRSEEEKDDEGLLQLTKTKQDWNKKVYTVRARAETPFGMMKNKFKSLQGIWREPLDQLEFTFRIACGIICMMKN